MEAQNDPRYRMWCRLIEDYERLAKHAKKKTKIRYAKYCYDLLPNQINPEEEGLYVPMSVKDLYTPEEMPKMKNTPQPMPLYNTPIFNTGCVKTCAGAINTVASVGTAFTISNLSFDTLYGVPNKAQQEKEETMSDQFYEQRRYLEGRARDLYRKKSYDLRVAFNIDDENPPTTRKDLAKRLKDGMYQIQGFDPDVEDDQDFYYGGVLSMIRWRDPSKKLDQAGFDAAEKLLDAAHTNLTDVIKIKDPTEGLTALQAFESQTFH